MNDRRFPAVDFLGLRLSLVDGSGVLAAVDEAVARRRPLFHAVLNAAKVVNAAGDPAFRTLLNSFDLICADGMSVVWSARLLGLPRMERVAGIDLMQALLERAESRGYGVYFLGATDEVLQEMMGKLMRRFPRLRVAGHRNGYFDPSSHEEVCAGIAASGADLLFVGMPTPAKESFLMHNRHRLGVSFAMGVGGTFDVLAGKVRRAPRVLQRAGLEWAFRLAQEPGRLWKRYLFSNGQFLAMVLKARFRRQPASPTA